MDKSLIDNLLNKYWDASTNESEEKQLTAYFKSEDVHESHMEFKPLFHYTDEIGQISAPDHLFNEDKLIAKVLEKYWQAESSLEDETMLRAYFNSDHVASDLMEYKPLFTYQATISAIQAPESKVKTISTPMPDTGESVFSLKNIRAIAAIAVFALASIFLIKTYLLENKKPSYASNYREIEDPQEAYEYTMAALAKLSKNYNKGRAELHDGMNNMNQVNIFKQQ